MTVTSFGKILTILDLFSIHRSVINVDIITAELGLSKPTSYRYLKELVAAELLHRLNGTSGEYVLGPKIAVLDYVSRTTDPLVQISKPFMQEISQRTELCCLLTYLTDHYCIDVHHEIFGNESLIAYGRGSPRPVFIGSAPKVIMAYLPKQQLQGYYQRFTQQLSEFDVAQDEVSFLQKMKKIKQQGYYLSQGEVVEHLAGLSVPIRFSSKEAPLALTIIASNQRFEYMNLDKLIETLKASAIKIEQLYQSQSLNDTFTG